MTLLALSSPKDPLSVWLSTELLIQQPVRTMTLFGCDLVRLRNMDQWPLAEEESQNTGREPGWPSARIFETYFPSWRIMVPLVYQKPP